MLIYRGFTFKVVHVNAVPAKDVPAVGHLGRLEAILQANSAFQLVSGMVDHLFNPLPFVLADALEAAQRL